MKNVFIIGSKGIPAKYGGFETFVEKLTGQRYSKNIRYHVSCMDRRKTEFQHNEARCFNVAVPNVGSARAVLYDLLSLHKTIKYIEKNKLENCIVYILACRIGPFISIFRKKLMKSNSKIFTNPDGHEWLRTKWNKLIRKYWKISEKLMVKHSDLLICDSMVIDNYIKREYEPFNPKTIFIPYGADIDRSKLDDNEGIYVQWLRENNIVEFGYYLVAGRFVRENNLETIIKEFMQSKTTRDLVIISNIEHNSFYKYLIKETQFHKDKRIKFVGAVYDIELLKKIREKAFAYIHGHEVGGTNPSLLEALAATKINLLYKVPFNSEVAGEAAFYFTKDRESLKRLIEDSDSMNEEKIINMEVKAKNRIALKYTWNQIIDSYETLFIQDV